MRVLSLASWHNVWKVALPWTSLGVQALADGLYLVAQSLVFLELVGNLLNRMERGRMVAAAESFADRRQR